MPRTKGAYQKRNFLDTSLGRFIYLVEPIVFEILCPNLECGYAPNIEIVIDEYIEYGLRVPRKKKITEDVVKHYEKIRNRRILKKI